MSQRFSITPAAAACDVSLPDTVFRTLAVLGMYGDREGWCWPSISAIAKLRGISRQAASKHIQTLQERGYLNIQHRHDKSGAQISNMYQVRFDYPPATSEVAGGATSEVAQTTHINDPKEQDTDSSPVQPSGDVPQKSPHIRNMERLEKAFSSARNVPTPDWTNGQAAMLNKRWRMPLTRMLKFAHNDLDLTERGIQETVNRMIRDRLTFAMPDQIEKSFQSWVADNGIHHADSYERDLAQRRADARAALEAA